MKKEYLEQLLSTFFYRRNSPQIEGWSATPVEVLDGLVPTTKTCSECGRKQNIGLFARV